MKKFICIVMCVFLAITPFIFYGVAIVKEIKLNANCIDFLKLSADANNVELAEKHLTSCIKYLEENNLTKGNTTVLIYKPTRDIGLWYENLKSAQAQLQELNTRETLTELEESNALMKLRETLLNSNGVVTFPEMLSYYPNHITYFWCLMFIWVLWLPAFYFGYLASEE